MSAERKYEGKSTANNVQEALDNALQRLAAELGEGGVRDASASWVASEIAGEYGGFAGFHSVKVKIVAKRSPDW